MTDIVPLTPADLDAIKARREAATDEPWKAVRGYEDWWVETGEDDSGPSGYSEPGNSIGRIDRAGIYGVGLTKGDAQFIAHAPTDIARLVGEVEGWRSIAENILFNCEREIDGCIPLAHHKLGVICTMLIAALGKEGPKP